MHKTEGADHSSNRFTNGPPGTRLEEDWTNAIQDEIRNVIEDAGLVLKTAATETGNQLSAAISLLATQGSLIGSLVRSKFRWKDADEIYIGAGTYNHQGTTGQMVYWDSELTYQFVGLGASDWSYLYIDDSAIIALGTNLLTAAEFIDSTTEPTYNAVKKGWYNGSDRCIFAVFTSGASAILEFLHNGNTVFFADGIENQAQVDIDNTWTDIGALKIPKFATVGICEFNLGVDGEVYSWRTNGQTGTVGHRINMNHQTTNKDATQEVITDSSQIIEIKGLASDTSTIKCTTEAWRFPVGI